MFVGAYNSEVGRWDLARQRLFGITDGIQFARICGNKRVMEKLKPYWKKNGPKNITKQASSNGQAGYTECHMSIGAEAASITEHGGSLRFNLFMNRHPASLKRCQ